MVGTSNQSDPVAWPLKNPSHVVDFAALPVAGKPSLRLDRFQLLGNQRNLGPPFGPLRSETPEKNG